jgi:hypothetical protein
MTLSTLTPHDTLQPAPYLARGRADAPALESGPVAEYLSMFPDRTFEWDGLRQMWAVWETDAWTGYRQRIEFVCNTLEADTTGETTTLWEADMFTGERRLVWIGDEAAVTHGGGKLRYRDGSRVYRPVDYPFVRYRVRDHARMRSLGMDAFLAETDRENEALFEPVARDLARERAAAASAAAPWLRWGRGGKKPITGRGFGAGIARAARLLHLN